MGEIILKPCPFCGQAAEIERYGNPRHSTIYTCTECGCRLETSEEFNHGAVWNTRAADALEALSASDLAHRVDLIQSPNQEGEGS